MSGEVKATDLFKPASKAEIAKRKNHYAKIRLKEVFDGKKTKLSDGTWHFHEGVSCHSCNLTTLENLHISKVDGEFDCAYNRLTNLEGGPKIVTGDFLCSSNKLTSLRGAPTIILRDFWCNYNKLTSLEGAPEEIGIDFFCHDNKLISLEGAPKKVDGTFYCDGNKKKFTVEEVRAVCEVNHEILL